VISSDLQFLTQIFAERLLNSAAIGIVLAALIWMLLRISGRQNAGTRFVVWFAALLSIVAFPFLSHELLPSLPYPGLGTSGRGEVVLSSSWAFYFCAVWAAGASVLLTRLGYGLWRVRAVRKNCTELNPATVSTTVADMLRIQSRGGVSLCTSSELGVPAAIGLFRPAIVFPAPLLPELSEGEIEMIVRHELAHLARWDDWTNLIQKFLKAVFFFHPAVWWIENRLTLEREIACDDRVLEQTASPRAYASSLISFAEKLHCGRGLALAQMLVSRVHQMSLRIAQILDAKRPRSKGLWKPLVGLSAGVLTVAIGAAPYMPRFIAFQSPTQAAQAPPPVSGEIDSPVGPAIAVPASLQQESTAQTHAIPAKFHPPVARPHHVLPSKIQQTPLVLRTSARRPPVVQETIFILRAPQLDDVQSLPPGIWTLCIWRVRGDNPNARQLESAIVVRLI
jgi:beta-lactamase regulating signal transducer with metallopeptidase domain